MLCNSLTLPGAWSNTPVANWTSSLPCAWPDRAFTRFRWNALRQRMAEEESGAWGSVDTIDVIVRLTGQQTNHATKQATYLVSSSMLTLNRVLTHLANPIRRIFQLQERGFYIVQCLFLCNFN